MEPKKEWATMSLFDTLQCDYPLPDPEFQKEHFQTKDLGSTLSRYRITADGRLWRLRQGVDLFAEDVPPLDPADQAEDSNYHGDFSFYTYAGKEQIEYRVRFTHGVVEWIRRATDEGPVVDSLAHLAEDAKFMERERQARLGAFFQRLENLDAEVAQQALETFGDRAKAAYWLGKARRQFGDQSPYEMLAQGQRREVLDTFFRIDHGFFA
jgi:hypothetical protein